MCVVAEFPTPAPSVDTRKGPGSWEVEQESGGSTRHSSTAIRCRSHCKSVFSARQVRLAQSHKQLPAQPGTDVLYLPFPSLPADRPQFALAMDPPFYPHRAFVSIPLPLLGRGEKVKTGSRLALKRITSYSSARAWMAWVDMPLPRHLDKSHPDCSGQSDPSMTSSN